MAEWVSRGVGSDVGWPDFRSVIARHFDDDESRRLADALLRLVLVQPSEAEIPYLHRILGSTFLANTVRLNPVAATTLRETLALFELYLDANVLLPLVVEEHPNHQSTRAIVEETRRTGARLFALRPVFWEVRSHRELARRDLRDLEGDVNALRDLDSALGMRTNVFVKGFLGAANAAEIGARPSWDRYIAKYSDAEILRRVQGSGVEVVEPLRAAVDGPLHNSALVAIRNEWNRKPRLQRDDILNANEATQLVHIYLRRAASPQLRNHVWFLSNEKVLHQVFERQPSKWELPATFPYSAWVAFLDARLPYSAKDPSSVVKAILRGQPEAFQLPSATSIVRNAAFGARVTSKDEEEALQYAMSDFTLMRNVERAQKVVMGRAQRRSSRAVSTATREAVGEIRTALDQQVGRLRSAIADRDAELVRARARIKELEAEQGSRSKPAPRGKDGSPSD
jgi:predicted nucleic acid-binding protein